MKKIVFFYPKIEDDGLKKTLITYLKFFSKKYKIVLVTGTYNLEISKIHRRNIIIDNIKFSILRNISFLNNFFCFLKIFKYLDKKSVFFSLDRHFYLLVLKFLKFNFNLILRIPNPISTKENLKNNFFSNYAGNFIGDFDLNLSRYANKVIVYSKKNLNFIKKRYKLNNLVLIRNFFEKKTKIKNKKVKKIYNIFFIGRLEKNKDPLFFLNSLIKISNLNFIIHIIGDGSEKTKLMRLKKRYNKKKIRLYGHVDKPFEKFHKNIDLFCLTSKFDGTPNVLGEAISYKIPCVAPKSVGSVNELLNNGTTGNIYNPGNEKSFINVVTKTLYNYKRSVKKANLAYADLDLYNKTNTLEKLNKIIINLAS